MVVRELHAGFYADERAKMQRFMRPLMPQYMPVSGSAESRKRKSRDASDGRRLFSLFECV